jgi:uncharacterized cysteine cluster protein YcgN (CxxCxxCC family)
MLRFLQEVHVDLREELDRKDWEAICRKCGRCCYEKVDLGGGVIRYTDEPCQYLDTKTNLCKVYENRHEAEPDCISLTEHLVRTLNWLPDECAYLEYIKYKDTLTAVRGAEKKRKRGKNSKRRH